MPLTLRAKIASTVAGFLVLLTVPAVLAYRSSNQFLASVDRFLLAQQGLSELRGAFSLVQDLETSQRGFTITGDTTFLAPYALAHSQVPARLAAVHPVLAETPGGPELLDSLVALVIREQAELDKIIEVRRTHGFAAASAVITSAGGRRVMDQIRSQVAAIEAIAERNLREARDRGARERRNAVAGLTIAGLGILVLAGSAGSRISKHLAGEQLAREQLARAGRELSSEIATMSATLAAQAEELGAIVSAVPVALVTVDRAGQAMFWSPGAERMFGWKSDEVIGKPLPVIPDERQEEYRRFREEVMAGSAFSGRETRRVRRDGVELDVSVSTAPLRDASGAIHGVVAAYVDMSEQRKLQEELRQSQKLEAIGRLAGGIAHDFNNILTAIFGFAERAARTLPADHPRRGDVEQIIAAADRAAGLTRQLLTFSRPQQVAPRVMDVGTVVRDMEPMLRRLLGERIDLRCSVARDAGRVVADQHHLEQVLLNLAINARDAMPAGGRLLIETAAVDLSSPYLADHPELAPGPYTMLAVTDTGTGMDPETRSRIFEPFFTTKGGLGSGLGLATVYGIVKQAGGGILVYSELGRGSTFKVYLPRTHLAVTPESPAPAPPARVSAAGVRVLLAEDSPAVRKLALAVLEDEGYRVRACTTGEEALEAASRGGRFDLLLTDLVLGSMDGAALAEGVRQLQPGIPVVYMSGYTQDTDIVRRLAQEEGSRFLEKPFRSAALLALVAEALHDGRAAASGEPA